MAEIIKFTPGVPHVIALKYDAGKNCEGKFGPQVQYTTTDGQIFWLDPEPASDIEREMQELGIRAGQDFKITKVKTSHGGHRYEIDRVRQQGDAGGHNVPSRSGAGRVVSAPVADSQPRSMGANSQPPNHSLREPETTPITPRAAAMCAAMMAAVDAVLETQAYATRKGLGLTFGEESVRAIGLSIYISDCKGGAR
jgi:hypothetical protein